MACPAGWEDWTGDWMDNCQDGTACWKGNCKQGNVNYTGKLVTFTKQFCVHVDSGGSVIDSECSYSSNNSNNTTTCCYW